MVIIKHLPALQILIPFFAALFSAISYNKYIAWLVALTATICSLILALYGLPIAANNINYDFGNWPAPIGIAYHLDNLNQPIIVYINLVLTIFLLFGFGLIKNTILKFIDSKRQHLFFTMLLFAHTGFLGVISTNDLFNLYVFIEISSLASYVLMSKGNNPRALVGAFDYLILGTIGATLILIAIGFLLAFTGSLNISDIATIIKDHSNSRIIITAVVFFITGAILKMAFFPMHFWMIRAYSTTSPFMLSYMAAISSIVGIYMIMRFIHFVIDDTIILAIISTIIRPMALITIIICTFVAFRTKNIKIIIIYSTASQIGYSLLLLTIIPARELLFQFLILDSINKIALFTIIAYIQNETDELLIDNFQMIKDSKLFKILVAFSLIFSAGLPLTSMFFIKIKIFDLLFNSKLYLEFIIVIIGSIFAILYHMRIVKAIYFAPNTDNTIIINNKLYGLVFIVLLQFISLLYINNIAKFTINTESILSLLNSI
ncbi:MAG: cation:proton antiporter [Rickettsiaceae bacterium]|nr:cation:proton antiporter [Rickettsiaceae bacterium]